jgi:hypothetical protein
MNPKKQKDVNQQLQEKNERITNAELQTFSFCDNMTETEQEELIDFIYNLSLVLYQSFNHESE